MEAQAIATNVANALKAKIPDLRTSIQFSIEIEATLLQVLYACPCGELSILIMEIGEEQDPRGVPHVVERLTHLLREHVRAEGNEPNF